MFHIAKLYFCFALDSLFLLFMEAYTTCKDSWGYSVSRSKNTDQTDELALSAALYVNLHAGLQLQLRTIPSMSIII